MLDRLYKTRMTILIFLSIPVLFIGLCFDLIFSQFILFVLIPFEIIVCFIKWLRIGKFEIIFSFKDIIELSGTRIVYKVICGR